MMKKVTVLLLVMLMVFAMAACGAAPAEPAQIGCLPTYPKNVWRIWIHSFSHENFLRKSLPAPQLHLQPAHAISHFRKTHHTNGIFPKSHVITASTPDLNENTSDSLSRSDSFPFPDAGTLTDPFPDPGTLSVSFPADSPQLLTCLSIPALFQFYASSMPALCQFYANSMPAAFSALLLPVHFRAVPLPAHSTNTA